MRRASKGEMSKSKNKKGVLQKHTHTHTKKEEGLKKENKRDKAWCLVRHLGV